MTSIKRNFAYNATYQLVRILTPLLTVPYLSRILGPDNVGVYSYTYSITNYFMLLALLGMSTYGVRAVATAGDNRHDRSRVFWSAYASQLSISAIVVLAYVVYTLTLSQGGLFICVLWGFAVLSAALDVSWLMFGVEDFRSPTIRSILVKLAELILIFLFVKSAEDLWVYIAIMSGGFLVSQLALWPFVPRYVDFVVPSWREVRVHYAPNIRLFIPVIAISLYTSIDKVLLGVLSTMTQTGFYEYSEKITKIPMALITALGTVMLPRMSSMFAAGDEEGGKELIETSMWFMQGGAFAMAFGVVAISPELAPVFLGEDFSECTTVMMVLAIVIPLISGSNVIGRQYLIPTFKDSKYTLSVICGAVVNVIVILILAPRYGALGAAIATVTAEGAVLFAQIWMSRTELSHIRYIKNAIPFAICGTVMAIAIRVSANAFNATWGMSVQGLVLEILVGIAVFCLMAATYCMVTRNRHFVQLFGSFLKK